MMIKRLFLLICFSVVGLTFCLMTLADTTFSDVSAEAGISDGGHGYDATFADYDNDGDMDIYVSNWGDIPKLNILYRNNGDGTFTDVAEKAGVANGLATASSVFGDYDNDGDLDLYLVNDHSRDPNVLYRNDGDDAFTDVTKDAGVGDSRDGKLGIFWDYNNDGHLDICATGGPGGIVLYKNNGDGTFTNVSGQVGVVLPTGGRWAHSVAVGDYDNDGDMDLYLARMVGGEAFDGPPDELYRNDGNDNHWLHIKTVGTQSNRDGIGARVTVKAGNLSQIRDVVNEWARSCPPVQFGLGEHRMVDSVEIRWPSGQVTILNNVPVDRMIEVTEGKEGYRVLHMAQAVEPSDKLPSTWGKMKVSKLYQNYPNPFNPETWIPYQLGRDSNVIIKIHTPSGQLVRTLELGDKSAGIHTDKTKAAYWDGRNEAGEPVTSGIYFYTIQTGDDYTATKKMVVAL